MTQAFFQTILVSKYPIIYAQVLIKAMMAPTYKTGHLANVATLMTMAIFLLMCVAQCALGSR
jgi:hypothetical protein